MSTVSWLSAAVEKTWLLRVGMVVLRSMSRRHARRPGSRCRGSAASRPAARCPRSSPARTPPWIAAPIATTSSGFTERFGSFWKISFTFACTAGHARRAADQDAPRRCPPACSPASFRQFRHGCTVRSIRSSTSDSNLARVSVSVRCLGPLWSAVMNGRLISACVDDAQLALGPLGGLLQALQRHRVLAQVDAFLLAGTCPPGGR